MTESLRQPDSPAMGRENVSPIGSQGLFPVPPHSFSTPQNFTPGPLGSLSLNVLATQPTPSPFNPDNIDPSLLGDDSRDLSPAENGGPPSTNNALAQPEHGHEDEDQPPAPRNSHGYSFGGTPDPFVNKDDVSGNRSYLWAKHYASLHKLKPNSEKELLLYAKVSNF